MASPRPPIRKILASHLVFHGYGHWLPNDPRGSGSESVRKDELKELGEIHYGRKRIQPTREELREFYRDAQQRLAHRPLWYRRAVRDTIGRAIGEVIQRRGYTVWACAVCSNHAHLVVRAHRDRSEVIWDVVAEATRIAVSAMRTIESAHPIWSYRPYKVFLYTPVEVFDRVGYVEENPMKEGLAKQSWDFVQPYRGTC